MELGLDKYIHPAATDKAPLEISLVPQHQIRAIFPAVAKHLRRATDMSGGRYTLPALFEKLIEGEYHLWLAYEPDLTVVAAVTSTFTHYPHCRSLHGQFLGGDRLEDWQDKFCEVFDRWGRENRCAFIEFTGRAGWNKQLARNGFKEEFRVYRREL